MIIRNVRLFNFRQFIGLQRIDFSMDKEKNVTVLVGANTSGKTTIIRAFEWCLYKTNNFPDKILLNKKVRDNLSPGDKADTYVEIEFIHDEKIYTLKRSITYTCISKNIKNNDFEVKLDSKPIEKLELSFQQEDGQTKIDIKESNIQNSINRVLPKDLSGYFFFGGERVENITDRSDLTNAVRGLMRLDIFENAIKHLGNVKKNFEKKLDVTGDKNAKEAKDAIVTYEEKKKILEVERDNAKQRYDHWDEKETEAAVKLATSNVEEVKKLEKRKSTVERRITSLRDKQEKTEKNIVKLFNRGALAFFGAPFIEESFKELERVKDLTECVPGMEQEAINYLIKQHVCICGREILPDSLEYNHLINEKKKLPPEAIGGVVNNYKRKAESFLSGNNDYCERLIEEYKNYTQVKTEIGDLLDEKAELDKIEINDDNAKQYELDRNKARKCKSEAHNEYMLACNEIQSLNTHIDDCNKTINKYAKFNASNRVLVTCISYTESISKWFEFYYSKKEQEVREKLEEKVNSYFDQMYHGKRTIKITDKFRVEYSDVKTDESNGLKAVKSFAFVTGLISIAKEIILKDEENDNEMIEDAKVYPMVMDAPFSNVDEIHIENICQILPVAANQVIIAVMEKDWKYASEKLKNHIGKKYNIEKDKDANGNEIDTLTHIKEVE